MAEIDFEFPPDAAAPSLPVETDAGLVYPRKGYSVCSAAEIATARWLGAKLTIVHGVIVPWNDCPGIAHIRPFVPTMRTWQEKRAQHPKESLPSELYKLFGNSVYGKVSQAVRPKTSLDTRTDAMMPVEPSQISNPYFATFIAGMVRAVLSELIAECAGRIVAATTDAVMVSIPLTELACSGPSYAALQTARHIMTGSSELLEGKPEVDQVIVWRTRGTATAVPGKRGGVKLARGGMNAPGSVFAGIPPEDKAAMLRAENDWFVAKAVSRDPDETWVNKHPRSFRETHTTKGGDFGYEKTEQHVSFDFDFKRRPVNVRPEYVRIVDGDDIVIRQHLAFDTVPWNTVEEFQECREIFTRWRRGPPRRTLRTIRDWRDFEAYWHGEQASKAGTRRSAGGPLDQARRWVIRAYAVGAWGLPGTGFKDAAKALTNAGYPSTAKDFDNARQRPKPLPAEGVIPAGAEGIAEFITAVSRLWPAFEPERLLQ